MGASAQVLVSLRSTVTRAPSVNTERSGAPHQANAIVSPVAVTTLQGDDLARGRRQLQQVVEAVLAGAEGKAFARPWRVAFGARREREERGGEGGHREPHAARRAQRSW